MKQRGILPLIFLVGLAFIIGGCSWASKLINFPQASDLALSQAKTTTTTIDFYVINLDDFPSEKQILRQELQKRVEVIVRQRFGPQAKIKEFSLGPIPQLSPPPSLLIDMLFGDIQDQLTSPQGQLGIIEEAITTKVKNNKQKFLVASIKTNPIDPAELCYAFERFYRDGAKAGTFYVDMDRNNKALRNKIRELLRNCSWR